MKSSSLNPASASPVSLAVYHKKLTQEELGAIRLSHVMLNLNPQTGDLKRFSLVERKVVVFSHPQKVVLAAAFFTFLTACSGTFEKLKLPFVNTKNTLLLSSSVMIAIVAFQALRGLCIISKVSFYSSPFPRVIPESIYNPLNKKEGVYSTPILGIQFSKEDMNKPFLLNIDGQVLTCLEYLKTIFTKELSIEQTLPHPITQRALPLEKHKDVLGQLLQVLNLSKSQFYSCWDISREIMEEEHNQLLVEIVNQHPTWFERRVEERDLAIIDTLIKEEYLGELTQEKERKTKSIFLSRRIDKFLSMMGDETADRRSLNAALVNGEYTPSSS